MIAPHAILVLQGYANTLEQHAAKVGEICNPCEGVGLVGDLTCEDCEGIGVEQQLNEQLWHVQTMIPKAIEFFYDFDRREKAMRWLGFIQGVLYCNGIYTIPELKQHSRPVTGKRDRQSTV